jgi:hypothetical protein
MLKFVRTIGNVGRKVVLRNLGVSQTFAVGDVIEVYSAGVGTLGVAAQPLLGVIVSFADSKGTPLPKPTLVAGTASGNDVREVTTDASNSDGYYAFVDISKDTVYSAEVNGILGTTNDSDLPGIRVDIDSANTDYGRLLESTATRTIGTPANFYSLGVDSLDSTRLMVTLAMSEIEGVKE